MGLLLFANFKGFAALPLILYVSFSSSLSLRLFIPATLLLNLLNLHWLAFDGVFLLQQLELLLFKMLADWRRLLLLEFLRLNHKRSMRRHQKLLNVWEKRMYWGGENLIVTDTTLPRKKVASSLVLLTIY